MMSSSQHWPSASTAKPQDAALLGIEAACNTIFVRNLSFDINDEILGQYFTDAGPVKRAFTVKDKNTDISRGFGFVEFSFPHDAIAAVQRFNGKMWYDRPLRVELALQQSKDPVQRQREKENHLSGQRRQHQQESYQKSVAAQQEQERLKQERLAREDQQYSNEFKKHINHLAAQANSLNNPNTSGNLVVTNIYNPYIKSEPNNNHKNNNNNGGNNNMSQYQNNSYNNNYNTNIINDNTNSSVNTSQSGTFLTNTTSLHHVPSNNSMSSQNTSTSHDNDQHDGVDSPIGCVILVTGLDQDVDEEEIHNKCSKYGLVKSIIYPSPESIPPTTEKPIAQLAARVTFASYREAKQCADALEGRHFGPNRCKPSLRILSSQAAIKVARLIVRNLSFKTKEDELARAFGAIGNVLEIHFPRSITGHMRGFGFVQMDSFENAMRCVTELNGTSLNGRPMTVDFTIPKTQFDILSQLKPKVSAVPPPVPKPVVLTANTHNIDLEAPIVKLNDILDQNTLVKLENGGPIDENFHIQDDEPDFTEDKYFVQEFLPDPNSDNNEIDDLHSELVFLQGEEGFDTDDEIDDEAVRLNEDDLEYDEILEEDLSSISAPESKKVSFSPNTPKPQDVNEGRTIFIRNLSYDTDEEALFDAFSTHGRILLVKICRDSVLNRSLGTAFIKFEDRNIVHTLLQNHAGQKKDTKEQYKKHAKQPTQSSLLSTSPIRVDDRDLILSLAVDRNRARELTAVSEKAKDKRNLYLSKEGVIMPDTEAAEGVSKADMEKRARGWQEKKEKLRNPNYSVSLTRLSVRNIPLSLTDKELRQLCYNTVKLESKKLGRKVGDIAVKQVRIEREGKKLDKDGLPRSRGFGFVEFRSHDHSLICSRALNNNPNIWGSHKRPMVEFALEDARKLLIHKKRKEKIISKNEKTKIAKITAESEALISLGANRESNVGFTTPNFGAKKVKEKEIENIFKQKGPGTPGSSQKRARQESANNTPHEENDFKKQRVQ